jgi:hypothetical protein
MNSRIKVFTIEAVNAEELEEKINEGLREVGSDPSYFISAVPCTSRCEYGFYSKWVVTCFVKC